LALVTAPAFGQWASLGDMPAPTREGASLIWRNAQGIASITPISDEIVRVRFSPTKEFGRDHSYAVATSPTAFTKATYQVSAQRSVIHTSALTVTVEQHPFRIRVSDASGKVIDQDDPAQGIFVSGHSVRVAKTLTNDDQVYGLGEKSGQLNRRGNKFGGYSYTMWNTDAFGYDSGTDPLYASIPFYMVLRDGKAHGIFLDNTFRSNFDIGKQSQGLLSFGAEDGELNYYLIAGPDPKDVISRYVELTGHMPLPPLWSLGYHQCRYSYFPQSRVMEIAQTFRDKQIPADTLWLDIHYLDGYNPLTWDHERFPDPAKMVSDLRQEGFHLVTIVDPHPAKHPGWDVYDSGIAGNHFVRNLDGSVYEAKVWPGAAEKNPANSVFPDFSRPATRDWWGGLYKRLTDIGVAGIWNDMNEPAAFVAPAWTMDINVRHDNEGQPSDEREIHNVYGQQMTRSTHDGLLKLKPDERPFVLTRATYAGGQRYAALWAGDNVSRWSDLGMSLPILMSLGMSGMPFVGVDIGGFGGAPTPELYTRWLQTGVFYPFMRTHTAIDTPDQEPWSYGPEFEAINKRSIELRYRLLPEIYNEMRNTSATGVPAMRPLMLEYPADSATWNLQDEFLFGADLLVAPVLGEAQSERDLYLPAGTWYDFFTGQPHPGGSGLKMPVTLSSIPVFAKAGAFIFTQPVVQNTGQMPGNALQVRVFPADQSRQSLYEDDGESFAYRKGASMTRQFSQATSSGVITIEIGAPVGSYRPAARSLELQLVAVKPPTTVVVANGNRRINLSHLDPAALATVASGWTVSEEGFVIVKMPDRFEATIIRLR
jgi:alpha-glucosidase